MQVKAEGKTVWGLVALEPGRPRIFDLQGNPQPEWKPMTEKETSIARGEGNVKVAGFVQPPDPVIGQKPRVLAGAAAPTPPGLPDKIQVVLLPDFEEQYAIRNHNILAKTEYNLVFGDDSTLAEMSGSYDATTIPVAVLKTLQKAITAAGEIRAEEIKKEAPPVTGPKAELFDLSKVYYICQETYIEPGIYRLQKSGERQAAEAPAGITAERATGLLTELGFPVGHCVTILSEKNYQALFPPPQ